MKITKENKTVRVIIVLALVAIFAVCKAAFAVNIGLDTGGVVYVCTESGTIEGTSTDTPMINPITVKTIVFAASASTDTCILTDGVNAETMLMATGNTVVPFGEGKVFKKGLRVHSMTSGGVILIYTK